MIPSTFYSSLRECTLLMITTFLVSCDKMYGFEEWNVENNTYYSSFKDSLVCQPTTIYLSLPNYKGGAYALKMGTYATSDTLSMRAIYVNDYGQSQTVYSIHAVTSGCEVEYILPPTMGDYSHAKIILSSQCTPVRVASISCEELAITDLPQNDFVFHAHLGYQRFAPENTVPGFECAGKSGFKACITNPISSSDGVLYCYHEDHKLLTKDNGKTYISLTAEEFQSLPSDSIEVYDAGMKFSKTYKGFKIAKLDDFFRVCKQYGMAPTFSVHPIPTDSTWRKIKQMSDEYGLTDKLVIKAFNTKGLKSAYSIFGTSIHSYVYMVYSSNMDKVISDLKKVNIGSSRVGIETGYSYWTEALVHQVLDNGYYASSFSIGNDGNKLRSCIKWGITEFTTDYFPFYSEWMDSINPYHIDIVKK